MKNIIFFLFIFVKILSVSGLTEFDQLNKFFNKFIEKDYLINNKNDVALEYDDNNKITSIYIKFSLKAKNKNFSFSEFPELPELKNFTLIGWDNLDVELSKEIFENPKLEQIYLERINVNNFANDYPPSSVVEKLTFKYCYIKTFPSELETLKNLKVLDLSVNDFESIPDINFPNLEKLTINNMKKMIKLVIPENIKIIEANNNSFTELSNKSSKNSKLEELIISGNSLEMKINQFFFNGLDQLKIIDFHNSKINELPNSIFGLKNLEKLDLSGIKSTEMEIINFGGKEIEECNFNDANILCYQPSTCSNISPGEYEPCSDKTIDEIRSNITQHSNKTKTIIVILLVIILGVVGCVWMYKIYRKRKQLKDADVIVSPTKNTSNYYDDLISNAIGADEKSSNRNTQTSFPPINSNGSVLPVSPESHTSISLNNVQNSNNLAANSNNLTANSTSVSSNINHMGRSPSVPVGHTTGPIMRSPTAPSGHSTIPMPRSRSVSTRYSTTNSINSFNNNNGNVSIDMTNLMVNNNVVIGNEKNKMLFNNQPYSHYSMAGSSSSSININQKVPMNENNNEANIQELEDIRLKKKILQEREMMEKYNIYNNYDDQDDPDNNLPPYSEI